MRIRSCYLQVVLLGLAILFTLSVSQPALSQTATGSIIGTVTDPSGAVVPGVAVTIRSVSTGATRTLATTNAGTYSATALAPGQYTVSYQQKGFGAGSQAVIVLVGETANGDFRLQVGEQSTSINVSAETASPVNTVQAVVQDVMTAKQIDQLPLNGRNFLDLAQLNAGAQIQDGGNLDPTKQGFAAISLQGRSGRSTRIEADGVDITDDFVGTTTINLSEESIQEFQVAQSTLDPANGVTSSGAVNVITRAGSNALHGSAFYLFRNYSLAARVGATKAPFDRSMVGWRVGGPFIKNKLFWFVGHEHTLQHGTTFVSPGGNFSNFAGAFSTPFHETEATARLDWNISNNWRTFYSFHFDQLNLVTGFGGISLQPFSNRNLNAVHTFALDGTTGTYTHSFRFGLMRFRNFIQDVLHVVGGLPQAFPGGVPAGIGIGPDVFCTAGVNQLCLGPNYLVPQFTLQRNKQVRYDGSVPYRSHTLRYGIEYVSILEGGFSGFIGDGPILNSNGTSTEVNFANANNTFGGGATNPLNYPLENIAFGNGLGFSSEIRGMGLPHGTFPGHRFSFYVGDVWKVKPNLTATLALRYNRVTGRTDSDARALPSLTRLIPGSDRPPRQANLDFAPQVGVAWDPFKDGKTSVRFGAGLFYDNFLTENILFDRPLRIPGGLANFTPVVNSGTVPGTSISVTPWIGQPIGSVAGQVAAAQAAFQAASAAAAATFNPNGIPGFDDPNGFNRNTLFGVLAPNLQIPRSVEINFGVQRQIRKSLFVSVDYLRNVNTHSIMNHDVNFLGAARTFNKAAAQAAIQTTIAQYPGCADIACTISQGATIQTFAANGLGSPANGLLTTIVQPNNTFAFGGVDPSFGQIMLSDTIGRSVYNALQVRLNQNVANPFPGVRQFSWQANYSLSRFNSTAPDQDVVYAQNARDNLNPLHFFGPNALDRTHMLAFGGTFDVRGGLRVSMLTRIYSALPNSLSVPLQCNCPAEIFLTDLTGDGTGSDLLPGTNLGAFGRGVKVGSLNSVINNFNSSTAGTLTPAGQALVSAGLFTSAQLKQLGAVVPAITNAPAGQVGIDNFIADDLRISYPFHLNRLWKGAGEEFVLEPTLDIFNVVNKANFDPPAGFITSPIRGVLDGSVGSANGTTYAQRANRYGLGTGVFSQGIPRAFEIGMRVSF